MAESDTLTVAQGRSKRSTAGNRMRELLEKAHQEDEDELFKEEADDEEFAAPQDIRDVYLEDFADTDDEVELDSDAEERALRKEERRKAKGKTRAHDPFGSSHSKKLKVDPTQPSSSGGPSRPSLAERLIELDPTLDPSTMAPSALVLTLRKKQREQKRLGRSEAIRSTLRTSTLKTEEKIIEKENEAKTQSGRKGRKAMHEGGEARGVRPMTQADLIAAALEEEERNREALRDWVKREEERRELRRVGRKRVRGPRWTFISRTVGTLVEEVIPDTATPAQETKIQSLPPEQTRLQPDPSTAESTQLSDPKPAQPEPQINDTAGERIEEVPPSEPIPIATEKTAPGDLSGGPTVSQGDNQSAQAATVDVDNLSQAELPGPRLANIDSTTSAPTPAVNSSSLDGPSASILPSKTTLPSPVIKTPAPPVDLELSQQRFPQQYARNYLIMSQIPGGLPEEMGIILGTHVDWQDVKYISHRGRPINRRPTISPFSGKTAKYKHPDTGIPYCSIEEYKQIQALLDHRYVWSEDLGIWLGGEEDVPADGAAEIPGWREAVHGGWLGGKEITSQKIEPEPEPEVLLEEEDVMDVDVVPEDDPTPVETVKPKGKRQKKDIMKGKVKHGKSDKSVKQGTSASGKAKGTKAKAKAKTKIKQENWSLSSSSPPPSYCSTSYNHVHSL
ncbi:YL1 nuclear protein-domain-containing protein [Kockovaella imperatae]|uniref:YL1 nuclear protein-domain-containing protein n=1 Tax=Kockovaella imperatae TaxID=4999 RepID=A0A1Y1UQE5_9TREE|nr:YL1 nuclear protein-domain-containing protein [Kockovaella imperatae]ORX40261.1 YL1 nuclear protein-domain-containing protein [Kockovaella imperatae]